MTRYSTRKRLTLSFNTGIVLLVALAAIPITVYAISRRQKTEAGPRIAFALLAAVLSLVAYVGTFGYAIGALEDFHNPNVSLATAVIGNLVMWAICLSADIAAVN